MAYNPLVHHRRSVRLLGYDYGQEGAYFITICCHEKRCLFGHIKNGEMHLNEAGRVVRDIWLQTPQIRPIIELAEFIIMPNHLHGIVIIRRGELHSPSLPASQSSNPDSEITNFRSPSQTIGAFVRGFKSAVTKQLKEKHLAETPVWQRNYYEHIIRNRNSYQHIADYITTNPQKWEADVFYQP